MSDLFDPLRVRRTDVTLHRNFLEATMLYWTVIFLVVALVAALFGFGGIAASAAGIAQILFYIFIILFVVSLIMQLAGRGRTPPL